MQNMTVNSSGNSVALPSTHRVRSVPSWVTALLNLHSNAISFLEIPSSSKYSKIFLEYCGQVAVDVTEDAPAEITEADSEQGKSISIEGKNHAARVYPGTLTALSLSSPSPTPMLAVGHKPPPPKRSAPESDSDDEDAKPLPVIPAVVLGSGSARIVHNGKDIAVYRDILTPNASQPTLMFFTSDPETLRSLVKTVVTWHFQRIQPDRTPQKGKYELYTLNGSCWVKQAWKKNRKLESIILPEGQLETIVEDFNRFMSKGTKKWYQDHGLPHRRSYLFYGPPGTGKTSTITALAGALKVAVCFMLLGDEEMSNSMMQKAMARIPLPALLVIEDVDALFNEDRKTKNPKAPLTFSGLLNVLDGLVSTDGVVTILTTNHIDKLDPALLRAGRVDRRFRFHPPSRREVALLFQRFYPDAALDLAEQFADKVFDRPEKQARNIATLHQHFIHTREKSAEASVEMVDSFFNDFYPDGAEQSTGLYS